MKTGLIKDNDTWQQLISRRKSWEIMKNKLSLNRCVKSRRVILTLSNIYGGTCWEKKLRAKAVNYFFKQVSAQIFETILNTPLKEGLFYVVLKFFIFPKILRCRSLRYLMGQFLNTFAIDDNPFSSKFLPLAR